MAVAILPAGSLLVEVDRRRRQVCEMTQNYVRWHTPHLSRDFEMLVFGHTGHPVIVFPTALGRYYEAKDCGLIEPLAPLVEPGRLAVFCPDGIDAQSWHNRAIHPADRVRTHLGFENVIRHDVLPRALQQTGRARVAVVGAGFGAYHAANFAFRHPGLVSHLFSLSGTFDIKPFLDGYYDENCYFNNPPDYLPNLHDEVLLGQIRQIQITLATGERDPNRLESRQLSAILHAKAVAHTCDDRPAASHDWGAWRELLPGYLDRISA